MLLPYSLAKSSSFSSLFNLQSKSINFKSGSFFTQIPRLLPYSLAKNRSFSSLFNLQSNSINVKFGHFHPNTKAIALLFGQKSLVFITFQSAIKLNQCQIWSFSPKYQGYSLTLWLKVAHFHHFSICNQNQSISNLVIFHQITKVIALLFGQKSLIFITFQSAIQINQFQIWVFVTKILRL